MDKQTLLTLDIITGILAIKALIEIFQFVAWVVRLYDKRNK